MKDPHKIETVAEGVVVPDELAAWIDERNRKEREKQKRQRLVAKHSETILKMYGELKHDRFWRSKIAKQLRIDPHIVLSVERARIHKLSGGGTR